MIGHKEGILALTLLPNGLLASGSKDGKIMIWNVSDTSRLYTLLGHKNFIQDLVVINNEYLASCSSDRTIKIWSLITYEEVSSWTASNDVLNALAFDPTLNVLVSGGYRQLRVWGLHLWTNITTKPIELT